MSHHPPSAAHYVFSKHGWSLWQEITISSKFRGKYLSIMPLGELGPCALPGQKDILDKGKGFTNPEASLGPPGMTLLSLQICCPPPQRLPACLPGLGPVPSLHEYCFQLSAPGDCGQVGWGLAWQALTSNPLSGLQVPST